MDFLELAFYLSVLTYVTGVFLKALPLPFLSLKKLGRSLITDGLFSAVLVFSYRILLAIIEHVGFILDVDWASYTSWLTERIGVLLSLFVAFKGLGVLLSRSGLGFLTNSFLNHVISLITTSLTTIATTSYLSSIIHNGAEFLLAIGLVLHAVPFRLTRSIGSTIIGVVIVFSTCLPLMPFFIESMTGLAGYVLLNNEDICSIKLVVLDTMENPVGYSVLEGYDEDLLYRYLIGSDGSLVIDLFHGFPCREHIIELHTPGYKYTTSITGVKNHESLTLVLPNALSIAPNRIIYLTGEFKVLNSSKSREWLNITIQATSRVELEVYIEAGDTLQLHINETPVEILLINQSKWYNVEFKTYFLQLDPGVYDIRVNINWYKTTPLQVDIVPYAVKTLEVDIYSPENILFSAVYLFIEYTVLPIIYITILFTASLSLARLLGGTSSSIARIVTGY